MDRSSRLLFLLLVPGVGLVVTLALVGVDRWLIKPRPMDLLPGDADSAPSCLKDIRLAERPPDDYASLTLADEKASEFTDAEVVETHDLAMMPPDRLRDLAGRRARFRVLVNCLLDREGDSFNVTVRGTENVGTVELPASEDIEDGMVVEGVLRVVDHPAQVVNGVASLGFTEYRVVDAVRVRP